jgi:hypothetical protein
MYAIQAFATIPATRPPARRTIAGRFGANRSTTASPAMIPAAR